MQTEFSSSLLISTDIHLSHTSWKCSQNATKIQELRMHSNVNTSQERDIIGWRYWLNILIRPTFTSNAISQERCCIAIKHLWLQKSSVFLLAGWPPKFLYLVASKSISDQWTAWKVIVYGPEHFSVPSLRTKSKCYQLILLHKLFSNLHDNFSEWEALYEIFLIENFAKNGFSMETRLRLSSFKYMAKIVWSILEILGKRKNICISPRSCWNRPFARSGHMVRNKLHWDANYAVGLSKQRKVGLDWCKFLCFGSPTA